MPVIYRNNTENAITVAGGGGSIPAGEATRDLKKYLTAPGDLTIEQYGDAPMTKLHAAAVSPTPATLPGLAKYKLIEIKNGSGATITCTINEDATNAYAILSGEIASIVSDREIEKIVVSGSGTGAVYAYGWK